MGDFKMGNNTVLTQSGTANPTFGSGAPTGAVLNVVSSSKTDIQTFTSTNTFTTITGLSCAITPKSTSNKILIMGHLSVGNNTNTARNTSRGLRVFLSLQTPVRFDITKHHQPRSYS